MITQKIIKELLTYDKSTGKFMWKKHRGGAKKTLDAGTFCSNGYIAIKINGKSYKAHRLAWIYVYGVHPKNEIDHINMIKTDNRIKNIRDVPHSINGKNIRIGCANSSGAIGVHFEKNKWVSRIGINGNMKYLGAFITKKEAIIERKRAEKKYW